MIAGNQSPSQSKTRRAGDAHPARNRARIPVTGQLKESKKDVGGVGWDIWKENAILLEADAGDIHVIDHMDHRRHAQSAYRILYGRVTVALTKTNEMMMRRKLPFPELDDFTVEYR